MASTDLVAHWDIPLPDGKHNVEFEHGTTSGKRIIRVDGQEIMREDWMFKLVGKEHFKIGKNHCCITIDAVSGFAYEYTLEVNGKSLKKFVDNQRKIMKTWAFILGSNTKIRIALDLTSLDVWVNDHKVDILPTFASEFSEDEDGGSVIHFMIGENHSARIVAVSSGKKSKGIIHKLYIDDVLIPQINE